MYEEEDYPEKVKRRLKTKKKQNKGNKPKTPFVDKRPRRTQKTDYLQEAEEEIELEEQLEEEEWSEAWDNYLEMYDY